MWRAFADVEGQHQGASHGAGPGCQATVFKTLSMLSASYSFPDRVEFENVSRLGFFSSSN